MHLPVWEKSKIQRTILIYIRYQESHCDFFNTVAGI